MIKLDVDDDDAIVRSVEEVKAILGDRGLDYVVNNAAVVRPRPRLRHRLPCMAVR